MLKSLSHFLVLPVLCLPVALASAQPRPNWPNSDPSGSRNGVAYARRYEVVTHFVTRGDVNVSTRDLAEQAVLSLQRAAANRANLTFVDTHLDDSRRSIRESRESGDFDTNLPNTPRRGNFIPATDRLELTITVEYRQTPKKVGGRALGQGVEYSQLEEALKVGVSGRVVSIDKGAIAYALQPVWLEKQATRDRRIEADKKVTLFGIEIPILPPVARAGGSQGSTTRQLSLLQQTFDEAANRLVNQLERSPQMNLQNTAPQNQIVGGGTNFWLESRGADGRTVYLTGRDARALRRGDELLLPVISRQNAGDSVVLKGRVTRAGDPCEVTVDGDLSRWNFNRQRPIRVLER